MKVQNKQSYESILKQTSAKKNSVYSFRKTYPAYIILFVFLAASFFVKYFAEKSITSGLSNEFNKSSNSVMNRLSAHYFKQIEVLNSMSGLYDVLVEVVKDYFELYATVPTRSYPSIMSVSYIPKVAANETDIFVTNAKGLGYFDYRLKTDGKSDFYYPFVNIVPEAKNLHRLGLDLSHDKNAMSAIKIASESNKMSSTDAYITRKPDTTGIYVFYPVYKNKSPHGTLDERKKNFQGVLSLEINAKKFISEALSGEGTSQNISVPGDSTIIFEITGTDISGKEYSVYKSKNYSLLGNKEPILKSENILQIADKDFKVKFYSTPDYGGKFQQVLPNLSLGISIILSFAFFGFVFTQLTNKAKALEIADKMTKSQRRIVDTSNDIIAVLDGSLQWQSMNPASMAIFGVMPDDMIGKDFGNYLADKNNAEEISKSFRNSAEDHIEKMDLQMLNSKNELIWVSWSFTYSQSDNLIYCIGRDVTLEKAAEADTRLRSKQIETAEIMSREANFSKTYFMKEMSHQLRNSLTGILGYLQLLQQKIYENEEELDMYVDFAASSSEELFTYVTDIDEAAKLNDAENNKYAINNIDLGNIIKNCLNDLKADGNYGLDDSKFTITENTWSAHILGDESSVYEAFKDSLLLLSAGSDNIKFDINTEINSYEGAVELQILSTGNKMVCELIDIYHKNSSNIIDALKYDKEDVLIKITKIASIMRLLRGSFKIDSFGAEDGNLISIIFKSSKKHG